MVANSDKQWWMVWSSVPADGGNQQRPWSLVVVSDAVDGGWWWMIVKANGERINWYEVRKIVVRKYKIEGEKIGTK